MTKITSRQFVNKLKSIQLSNVFNPYTDHCAHFDRHNAAGIRRRTLLAVLDAASLTSIDSLWLGRDLGYRGGRRTGLALTDDVHVNQHAARWQLNFDRATKGPIVKERTAAVAWQLLAQIKRPVFLWNVFPFHPHLADQQFGNRAHTAHEREIGEQLCQDLIALLQPKSIIAIGQHATQSALRLVPESKVVSVRHPSYGGQTVFLTTLSKHYDLSTSNKT